MTKPQEPNYTAHSYEKLKLLSKKMQFQVKSPGLVVAREVDVMLTFEGKNINVVSKTSYLLSKLKERVNGGDYVLIALGDKDNIIPNMTGSYEDLKKEIINDFNLRQQMQSKQGLENG